MMGSQTSASFETPVLRVLKLKRVLTLLRGGHAFAHKNLSHSSNTTLESGPNKPKQIQESKIRMSMKH